MCFSPFASFAVGTGLLAAGGYCVRQALRKRLSLLGLAVVPILFGLQQISEGFVWLGLERDEADLTRTASLVFLLFALAIWPFWFPMQAGLMERQRNRRWILVVLSVLSIGWYFALYLPILRDPSGLLETRILNHSITYDYPEHPLYRWISPGLLRIVYMATVALPFVIGTESFGRGPGVVLGLSAVVSILAFDYAFVSVWCFFAAVLALYACIIFHRLPERDPTIASEPAAS